MVFCALRGKMFWSRGFQNILRLTERVYGLAWNHPSQLDPDQIIESRTLDSVRVPVRVTCFGLSCQTIVGRALQGS